MPSKFVWESFGRFTSWSEWLWTPPIRFEKHRREFKGTKGRHLWRWYLSNLTMVLMGALMISVLFRNIFSPHSSITILEVIFIIFFITTAILILVLMHLSIVFQSSVTGPMNELIHLDQTLHRCKTIILNLTFLSRL
jgi:hypothetical protein